MEVPEARQVRRKRRVTEPALSVEGRAIIVGAVHQLIWDLEPDRTRPSVDQLAALPGPVKDVAVSVLAFLDSFHEDQPVWIDLVNRICAGLGRDRPIGFRVARS